MWQGKTQLKALHSLISEITELKTLKGLALQDILTEIHLFVHRGEDLWGKPLAALKDANHLSPYAPPLPTCPSLHSGFPTLHPYPAADQDGRHRVSICSPPPMLPQNTHSGCPPPLLCCAACWQLVPILGTPRPTFAPCCRYRLAAGTSEKIQLSSLIAAFQVTRDLIVAEA